MANERAHYIKTSKEGKKKEYSPGTLFQKVFVCQEKHVSLPPWALPTRMAMALMEWSRNASKRSVHLPLPVTKNESRVMAILGLEREATEWASKGSRGGERFVLVSEHQKRGSLTLTRLRRSGWVTPAWQYYYRKVLNNHSV